MAWCPKCKKRRWIGVTMSVYGILEQEAQGIDQYAVIQGEAAEPTDTANCMECEYEAPLSEFVEPKSGQQRDRDDEESS